MRSAVLPIAGLHVTWRRPYWWCVGVTSEGSFENEALENEDRSTKHLKTKTEVRSTQISKTKHQKLETTVGWRTRTLCLARRKPYQVEATNASAPPKVHKSIPRFYVKPANRWTERFYIGSPVLLAKRYLISIFRYTCKFIVYASVNSTCAQPPLPPSGWPLGISIFFFLP